VGAPIRRQGPASNIIPACCGALSDEGLEAKEARVSEFMGKGSFEKGDMTNEVLRIERRE